jgi:DNA-binding LacI/PurR family transcriptional regulator
MLKWSMEKRPTMRDIAKIANVSVVTVSLALRKHSSIPASTRERIEAIGRQIGYRPDPALSALMVYRRGAKPSGYHGTIAWINAHSHPEHVRNALTFSLYFQGAQDCCVELGYKLEEFPLIEFDMNFRKLSKVLYSRNIQGVIFPPMERDQAHISPLSFAWDRFSAVAVGFSLAGPQLHMIGPAQFRSARLAVRKLRSLGYRRIGCINNETLTKRTDSNFLGGYLVEVSRFPAQHQVPIFTMTKSRDHMSECKKWYQAHKPDAILDFSDYADYSRRLSRELKNPGFAFASIDVLEGPSELAGINQNNRLVGRTAVDEVVSLILSNKRGIPKTPKRVLIEGCWINGPTAPRITGETVLSDKNGEAGF